MKVKVSLLICILIFVGNVFAQKPSFSLHADSSSARIGMPFILEFHIFNPEKKELVYPSFIDSIDSHFDILKVLKSDTVEQTVILKYQIAAYEFGNFKIGPFPYRYEENGMMLSDSSNSLNIEIIAPEVDTTKGFMDIYGPVDMPFSWKEMIKPVSIIGGIILAIVLISYWVLRYLKARKAKKQVVVEEVAPPIDPYKEARDSWQHLKNSDAANEWDAKLYYTAITDILRIYFERTLHFNAPEMISDEIIDALKSKKVDSTIIEQVRSILQNADLAKFAKSTPAVETRVFDLDKTWIIIEKLHVNKEGGSL